MTALVELQKTLHGFADSLVIHSPSTFTVHGHRYESDPSAGVTDSESESVLHTAARRRLEDTLYAFLHCRVPADSSVDDFVDWVGATDFLDRLSHANCGQGPWQSGWVVRGIEVDGRIVAERHGIRFWVPPDRFRTDGRPPDVGIVGRVKVPNECREWVPGFYWVLGDADDPGAPLVRVYWNITAAGAVRLTAQLTRHLNAAGLPFHFKVLNDPIRFGRVDAAVLYLPRSTYSRSAASISSVYREVKPLMRTQVSAYVKRLAGGLGVAEDPGDGESFGRHCSRLVAAALSHPECAVLESVAKRCDFVFETLRRTGYDPASLYLNNGSVDSYDPLELEDAVDDR